MWDDSYVKDDYMLIDIIPPRYEISSMWDNYIVIDITPPRCDMPPMWEMIT